MHKLKIALLLFLIVPIVAACTTTKKFELEGTWTSISKDIDANSSYSIIKKIEFESNGLATITYEDEKQVKIGYNFDSKKASNKKYGQLKLNYTDRDITSTDVLKVKNKDNQIKLDIGYMALFERTN
ncbi:MAG: hypothetical protein IKD76_03645 [Clostridia bacterium]|uniref:hypothetical protein n=1 Tax=Carnobacterium maltaromaticum TaxID=2751 RepID=UPI00054FFB8B|nr:hypothetical protein [Carnobacterium maltaromaticum]KRN68830.1 hypothetical protein IV70_GL000674 [Carnobacterium maltaromaticum DSM 20342]MBQ2671551.1 hypothetical protein [Clostridia bacterium]MBR2786569.1 hypothetical protein [Clostridia bacterium]